MRIADRAIVGRQALVRGDGLTGRSCCRGQFIGVAEQSGLIIAIGEWVLEEACRQAVRWRHRGMGDRVMAVNVSLAQFQRGNMPRLVQSVLERTGMPGEFLELELTESVLLQDAEAALETLHALKRLGVKLSIDDFGTGYSSLAYLKRLAVDRLKIAKAFIQGLPTSAEDAAIVRAIIELGHAMELQVIGEGVETQEQLEFLERSGCDQLQGFLFSTPLPPEQIETRFGLGTMYRSPSLSPRPENPMSVEHPANQPIRYADLVDSAKLQALMESCHQVIGIANGVIDVEGNVLARAGWQEVCTRFHRTNPHACRRCVESDTLLAGRMTCGDHYAVYQCLNGMTDTASPIVVDGLHIANVFTGQFHAAAPDLEYFARQARQLGFDEVEYLEAVQKAPVVPPERVRPITELYAQLASMLAESGMDRLKQQRAGEKLERLNRELETRIAERTEALARSEARYRLLIEQANEGIAVVQDDTMRFANPRLCQLLGMGSDLIGLAVADIVHHDDQSLVRGRHRACLDGDGGQGRDSFRALTRHSGVRWFDLSVARFDWDGRPAVLWFCDDISERLEMEEKVRHLAFYDALTDLPNRSLLEDRLDRAIARADRQNAKMSLLFVDLDRFKPVNDRLGHDVGDWLLKRVAERMQSCLRASDTVARVGGDEFVVLLPEVGRVEDAAGTAEKVRLTLQAPFFTRDGAPLAISCSIGVAVHPDHATTARDLLRRADEAMYRAKTAGGDGFSIYSPQAIGSLHLNWLPEYECGEPTLDREHREMFRLANLLLGAVSSGSADRCNAEEAFIALIEHVSRHFKKEEEILRDHGYALSQEHSALHSHLTQRAEELRKKVLEGAVPIEAVVEFVAGEVVARHMLVDDRKYFGAFRAV